MAKLSYYFILSLMLISLGTKSTFADDDDKDDKDEKEKNYAELCKKLENATSTTKTGGSLYPASEVNTFGNNVTSGSTFPYRKSSFIDVQSDLPIGQLVKFFFYADGVQQGKVRLQIWREVNTTSTYVLSWEHSQTLSQTDGTLYTIVIPKDKRFDVKEKDVMGFSTEGGNTVPISYRSATGHKTLESMIEGNYPNLEEVSTFSSLTNVQFSMAVEILDCDFVASGASLMVPNFLIFCWFFVFTM